MFTVHSFCLISYTFSFCNNSKGGISIALDYTFMKVFKSMYLLLRKKDDGEISIRQQLNNNILKIYVS